MYRRFEHITERFSRFWFLPTGAIFFDVAKRFDNIWQDGSLYKLYNLGVPDRLVHITWDFLSNHSFRYRVEGAFSSPQLLRAWVPEGYVLLLLLFTQYTSDLLTEVSLSKSHSLCRWHRAILLENNPKLVSATLRSTTICLGEWLRKWRIEVKQSVQ